MELDVDLVPECENMLVPSFLVQPLVENAVQHAMPSEGKLTITVTGEVEGDDVYLRVSDNGTGMTEEARQGIMHPKETKGIGIAVKNVHDRIVGFFGPNSYMDVQSELGVGTTVTLFLEGCAAQTKSQVAAKRRRKPCVGRGRRWIPKSRRPTSMASSRASSMSSGFPLR